MATAAEITSPEQLRDRTKAFANRIIRLYRALPSKAEAQVIGKQLLRAGTSVGANYRAACRGRSRPDFNSRLGIVVEEADETIYWLELLAENGIMPQRRLEGLLKEAHELTAIFTASLETSRSHT
ncbi:MAG: four helix bundle protein [Acidobacteriia bacterium]|nr:four helix bundle protein [Terriglobia bacterium]